MAAKQNITSKKSTGSTQQRIEEELKRAVMPLFALENLGSGLRYDGTSPFTCTTLSTAIDALTEKVYSHIRRARMLGVKRDAGRHLDLAETALGDYLELSEESLRDYADNADQPSGLAGIGAGFQGLSRTVRYEIHLAGQAIGVDLMCGPEGVDHHDTPVKIRKAA